MSGIVKRIRTWLLDPLGLGRRAIRDFQAAFPGKCPICSYHRYGIREGHEKPGTPIPPHANCVEAKL